MKTKVTKRISYAAAATAIALILVMYFGSYSAPLASAQTTRSCGGWISPYQWVSGRISVGRPCRYTFTGRTGQIVTVIMEAQSTSLDPWLDLQDPVGIIVRSDDDGYGGRNSQIYRYRLRRSGTYTILARSYDDASAGSFWLYWER